MKRLLLITAVLMVASLAFGQLIINEIDYDQPSTDAAEYIELAGPAGTYNNVVVDLVNGNDGASYKTITVGNITLADESAGYGFYVIGVAAVTNVDFTVTPETNLIQNGSPDGVQLKVDGVIVDAVAYEGSLNDLAGNAMEVASIDSDDKWVGACRHITFTYWTGQLPLGRYGKHTRGYQYRTNSIRRNKLSPCCRCWS